MRSNLVTESEPALRASDADREQATELLRTGYAEGRLTRAELDERLTAAYAARTVAQLRGLSADLPGTRAPGDGPPAPVPAWLADAPGGAWFYDPCLMVCLLFACPPVGVTLWILSARTRARQALPSPV
ncbi:MAG: DUF1707 SHOCT-like domain-containing protein [Streptosporangiaceae bacterium]